MGQERNIFFVSSSGAGSGIRKRTIRFRFLITYLMSSWLIAEASQLIKVRRYQSRENHFMVFQYSRERESRIPELASV